jgi:mono/diheme cytochrome c family protein
VARADARGSQCDEAGDVKRWSIRIVLGVVALLALAQVVPYGRSHHNPASVREPAWDSPQTRTLAVAACFDCHSNLTTWPWYSNVAPGSWLIYRDVVDGRGTLNFSEWQRAQDVSAGDIAEAVRGGSMPPWYYKLLHPKSRLSAADQDRLARGLEKTLALSPPGR